MDKFIHLFISRDQLSIQYILTSAEDSNQPAHAFAKSSDSELRINLESVSQS